MIVKRLTVISFFCYLRKYTLGTSKQEYSNYL